MVVGIKQLILNVSAKGNASAFLDRVGDSAKEAGSKVGDMADKTDNLASKSSVATGGLGALSSGFELVGLDKYANGLVAASMATDFFSGVGDLATLALQSQWVMTLKSTAATAAKTVVEKVAAGASKALAAGQWLVNAAMTANPIGLVVVAVAALVAGMVIAYKKSETFRNVVDKAMAGIAAAGRFMWNNVYQPVLSGMVTAISKVMDYFGRMLQTLGKAPGMGWVGDLGDKLVSGATKADRLAKSIKDIPEKKTSDVRVNVYTKYTQSGEPGEYNTETSQPNPKNPRSAVSLPTSRQTGASSAPLVVQLVLPDGRVIQQLLLKLKQENGGFTLGLA